MPPNDLGFVATEYVSGGGVGDCLLKLYGDGWHVRVWRGKGAGYVNTGLGPCATLREALEAYETWNAGVNAGKVQW